MVDGIGLENQHTFQRYRGFESHLNHLYILYMLNQLLNFQINFLELKYRILYSLFSFTITFFIYFEYKIELFFFISKNLLFLQPYFIYTSLFDPLITYFKLSFFYSILTVFPLLVYFFLFFFLKSFFTSYIYRINLIIYIFYFITIFFYYIFFNLFLNYFFNFLILYQRYSSYSIFELRLEATISQYYSLYINMLGVYFTSILIPVIFLILALIGFIKREFFLGFKYRKYVYLILIILLLILSPPDLSVQLIILPVLLLIIEIYLYLITFYFLLNEKN